MITIEMWKEVEIPTLRQGQIETYYIDPKAENLADPDTWSTGYEGEEWYHNNSPERFHLLIKIYFQTDEEAGGTRDRRFAMLDELEGKEYYHNGFCGIYKNVGSCTKSPQEFAVRTILIRDTNDILDLEGDWDYDVIYKSSLEELGLKEG